LHAAVRIYKSIRAEIEITRNIYRKNQRTCTKIINHSRAVLSYVNDKQTNRHTDKLFAIS